MTRLLAEAGVNVVAKARDADSAVAAVEEYRPDILVAGVSGGSPAELACIRRAKDAHPELKSVVMAEEASPESVESAFAAGASIYCVKTAERDDLASAIRHQPHTAPMAQESKEPAADLTRRELEILKLVAEGHSNSQLARMLWVTEQTVKFHLSNIYRKLNVANRTEASRWAQLNGLLSATRVEAESAVA
jgi:DNA-binding NarL/FixJ family response regulator